MSHNRIGCHTAYQHYQMFHGHGACCNSGPSSIFNVVYNTGHHCCGGSSWGGGFWGGIGMGIGMGVANLFGGMFGNMFGGMFGGGMGFGFPGFGGGFGGGWGNFWGGGSGVSGAGNSGNSGNNSSSKGCTDADDKLIKGFKKKLDKLKPADLEQAKELYTQIKAKKEKPEDSEHEIQNKLAYAQLLDELLAKAKENKWNLDGTVEAEDEVKEQVVVEAPQNTDVVNNTQEAEQPQVVEDLPKEGEITLGGKKINIDDIKSIDDLKGLTPLELAKIKPEDIVKILGQLGIKADSDLSGKAAKSYEVLLLIKEAKISVRVAQNTDTKTKTVKYHWVKGRIIEVNKDDTTGYVSYNVDCKECGCGEQGNIYKFTQTSDKNFKVEIATDKQGKKLFGPNIAYDNNKVTSVEYTISDDTKPMTRCGRRFTKDTSIKGNK